MSRLCSSRFERAARQLGWMRIAGLDEAGGALSSAPSYRCRRGHTQSQAHASSVSMIRKTSLPSAARNLPRVLHEHALAWAVAEIDAPAHRRLEYLSGQPPGQTAALQQLSIQPDYLLIDAMQPDVLIEQKSLIKGDARSVSIAAASILAKTHRDKCMEKWDAVYPQYGLARHKGYATPRSPRSPSPARSLAASSLFFRARP